MLLPEGALSKQKFTRAIQTQLPAGLAFLEVSDCEVFMNRPATFGNFSRTIPQRGKGVETLRTGHRLTKIARGITPALTIT